MSSREQVNQEIIRGAADQKIPLLVILGPTAVGKTEISIRLAEKINGEIVSADSRLFYRGMDIGTAKPSREERSSVPHHLIDVADPDEIWSLALFQLEANIAIHKIADVHHLPMMVGGTGQFFRAVIEGWKVPPAAPDSRLREVLTNWANTIGSVSLHSKLAILDPVAARSIDPTNVRRTIRALEVILLTGRRFSDQRERGHMLYSPLLLGLTRPRAELYQRIDNRISKMVDSGFVDEVKHLLEQGYSPSLPTLSAIGYREMVAYVQGRSTLEEAMNDIKRRTREFVRRQANWFKQTDPAIRWFTVDEYTVDEMEKLVKGWLTTIK